MRNGLVQHIAVDESASIQWVKLLQINSQTITIPLYLYRYVSKRMCSDFRALDTGSVALDKGVFGDNQG